MLSAHDSPINNTSAKSSKQELNTGLGQAPLVVSYYYYYIWYFSEKETQNQTRKKPQTNQPTKKTPNKPYKHFPKAQKETTQQMSNKTLSEWLSKSLIW